MFPLQALSFATLVLLAVLQSAASTANVRRQVVEPPAMTPFITASLGNSAAVHVQPINANNKTYWDGKPTTALALLSSNQTQGPTAAPSTWTSGAVPPQRNYIASNGALSFLPACQQTFPRGFIHGHFNATVPFNPTLKWPSGQLGFTPDLSRTLGLRDPYYGWLACPSGGAEGPFQIFAALKKLKDTDVPGGHVKDCLDIIIITDPPQVDVTAYQYV